MSSPGVGQQIWRKLAFTLYGKGEGILQMQLNFSVSWFGINQEGDYPGWVWANQVDL